MESRASDTMKVGAGIGISVAGFIILSFFGVWYMMIYKAKAAGFVGASAYGPYPMSYGISGPLVIVGAIIAIVGIAIAVVAVRQSSS